VKTGEQTKATSSDELGRMRGPSAAARALPREFGVPNKPMVPAAATSPTTNPLYPMRRHIGQSLGSYRAASDGLRKGKSRATSNEHRGT